MEEVDPAHQYNGREERSDTMKSDQESDAEGQSGSSLQNLKGSRPKKSAFQITSVEPKGNDNNHGTEDHDVDSQDELEESRVDDASSSELLDISNLSKGSINSEIDKSLLDESNAKSTTSLPDRTGSKIVPVETVNIDETALADVASDTNGNGPSRFRVVKVPNPEPVKRGRWTCKDFPSESQQGQAGQDKLELIPSGDSSAGSSVHYVPEESATDPTTGVTKGARKRPVIRQTSSRKVSVLDTIIMNMKLPGEDDESAATAGAIDNKIAQAMDIVKGHLLLAVREEVEVLKEQITELQDANEQLREENSRLRDEKTSSQPHSQMINMGAGSTQETPYQRIQPNQSTQQPMHTSSTYHHQSIQGQPQISSSTSTGAPPPTEHYQPLSTHHPHSQTPAQEQQQQPPYMPPAEEPGASYHAIPSQPPHGGTGTTNAAPGTEQQFQQQTQGSQRQQPPPTVTTEPHTSGMLNPSQYQPQHAGSGMEQQQQQHYQSAPVHHQLGASEHSQSVPPPTTALPHSQGEQQQGHL